MSKAIFDTCTFVTMSGSTYTLETLSDGKELCTVTRKGDHHLDARERFVVTWRTEPVEGACVRMEFGEDKWLLTTPVKALSLT